MRRDYTRETIRRGTILYKGDTTQERDYIKKILYGKGLDRKKTL